MKVIAMSGLAQSGKSLLAKWIAESAFKNGMTPKMMSFAGSLKRAAVVVGADKEGNPALYRKFCQDTGRNLRDPEYLPGITGNDYWVNLTRRKLAALKREDDERSENGGETYPEIVAIFDDVRYMNELGMLRDWDAATLFVDRRNELPDPDAPFRQHESEAMAYQFLSDKELMLENFGFHVNSTGTTDAFRKRVERFLPVWAGAATLGLPRKETE